MGFDSSRREWNRMVNELEYMEAALEGSYDTLTDEQVVALWSRATKRVLETPHESPDRLLVLAEANALSRELRSRGVEPPDDEWPRGPHEEH